MTDTEFKYWAFVAYSRQDNCEQRPGAGPASHLCWGDWILEALETFSVPPDFVGHENARGEMVPARIQPVFRDEQERADDAALSPEIREALEQSRCLVVICSPRSAKSLHVNELVRHFNQLGRGSRILPMVVAGEPYASHGTKPGLAADDECFVPVMCYPLKPDGTLATNLRERRYIFADARYGPERREILAADRRHADTELQIARIQLIAGLVGVGFNGLWQREQARRFIGFAEAQDTALAAQNPARESLPGSGEEQNETGEESDAAELRGKVLAAESQARQAQDRASEAEKQARETQLQLQAARQQAGDAQTRLEEARQQARLAQAQAEQERAHTREAGDKAVEAQKQAHDAQLQIEAARQQAGETQRQLEAARQQVQAFQAQVEEARRRAQEIEQKILEVQTPAPQAQAEGQAPLAQDAQRTLQLQVEVARNQAGEAQQQAEAARRQATEMKRQLEEARQQVRAAESQAEQARAQAREGEGKALEAQKQAGEAQIQAEAARRQATEMKRQLEDAQQQARAAEAQAEQARAQARHGESLVLEAQKHVREAQFQAEAAREKAGEAQRQTGDARQEVRTAQTQTEQARSKAHEAQVQNRAAQDSMRAEQNKTRAARRLLKVFAVMAVLAALAAGVAWRQRQAANQALARAVAGQLWDPRSVKGNLDAGQIRQALERIGGAEPAGNRLRSLDALAGSIAAEGIPDALKLAPALAEDRQRTHFQKQLLVRLAAADPALAMTCARAVDGKIVNEDGVPDSNLYLQSAVLENWLKSDPAKALDWVRTLSDTSDRGGVLGRIVPPLAAANPTNTLAFLNDLQPAPGAAVYRTLFQCWATNDPAQAIQQLSQLPGQDEKGGLLSAILAAGAARQPGTLLSWLRSQPDGPGRNQMITALIHDWAEGDADAADSACRQLPDGAAKDRALEMVLDCRIKKDPASAAASVTNLPPGDARSRDLAALCEAWAATDSAAALDWAKSLPAETGRSAALDRVVQAIAHARAQQDLTNALAWAHNLPDDGAQQAAMSAVQDSWVKNDPQSVLAYALSLPAGEGQTQLLTAACRRLPGRDLPGVVETLQPLPDTGLRTNLFQQCAESCDASALDQAAKFVAAMPAGDDQNALIRGLLAHWKLDDPETAANWLDSFPETNSQTAPLASVIESWACHEPAEAARWLAGGPAETNREGLVTAFLNGAAGKYPEFAAQWTASVTNAVQRQTYQVQVARQWLKTNPAAATNWVNTLDLPDDVKQSLK